MIFFVISQLSITCDLHVQISFYANSMDGESKERITWQFYNETLSSSCPSWRGKVDTRAPDLLVPWTMNLIVNYWFFSFSSTINVASLCVYPISGYNFVKYWISYTAPSSPRWPANFTTTFTHKTTSCGARTSKPPEDDPEKVKVQNVSLIYYYTL